MKASFLTILINFNWFKFTKGTIPTVLVGDLNGDNSVDAIDYALMKKYLIGTITDFPVKNDIKVADVNGGSEIDALDFAAMKQYLLGKITKFPAE